MTSLFAPPTPEQLQELLNGPAQEPPVGAVPNFKDPSNLNNYLIWALVLCVFVATLTLFLRLYTKAFIIRSIAYEDYVIILAWLSEIGRMVCTALCSRYGGGSHMWNVQLKTFFQMLYWVNISNIVYCPVVVLVKTSILLQYLRIFVPNKRSNMATYIAIHVCIWSCVICYIIAMAFEIAMCSPREKIWNPLLPGHCFNNSAAFLGTGIFNLISDFGILLVPMPVLWRLQIPLRKKVLMSCVFGCGFLACITSIIRTYYSWKMFKNEDLSYTIAIIGLWSYVEIGIGITVSHLPVLPRFFQHFGPKIRSSIMSRYKISLRSGSASTSDRPASKETFNTKMSKPFLVHTETTSHRETVSGITGGYVEISDFENPPAVKIVPSKTLIDDVVGPQLNGIATMRDDLELGAKQENYY